MERMQRVNRGRPCVICGKTDWCGFVSYPSGDVNHFCPRTAGSVGEMIQGIDGKTYRVKMVREQSGTVFETIEQYERNREAFIQALPKRERKDGHRKGRKTEAPKSVVSATKPQVRQVQGVSALLSPAELDRFYRKFLSLLVLERKHEDKLREEWDKKTGLYGKIMAIYPIKSLPPEDVVRFSSKEKLKNKSRKKIMQELVEDLGEPKGVPGFYQRKDGSWTCYRLSGIVFPVYNSRGQIIRLRVNDDYPDCEGVLDGKPCLFRYMRDGDNGTGWFAMPLKDDGTVAYAARELVWEYGSLHKRIELTSKGYPKGAKVNGKYKNFSSYQEQEMTGPDGETYLVNVLTNGCRSGSACSLYTKEGDDLSVVYATEGEKKAIVANAIMNVPVISIPGVTNFGMLFRPEEGYKQSLMEALKERGMRIAVLVYDADKNTNDTVLRNEKNAVEAFRSNGIKIGVGEWNEAWGKGLDDILLEGVFPKVTMV